jgi:ABC-type multidrug transport system permease subunit
MPFLDNNKYQIFTFSKLYTIEESYVDKLKKLEGYREFIWSHRPYIWIPILMISAILSGIISSISHNFDNIKTITVWISLLLYMIVSLIYYLKIKKIIKDSEKSKRK